ncbi:MAG TPA: trehalose-phosphatase [Longimicrobiales bacterium]
MIAHATQRIDVLRAARRAAGSLLVGLDFDGTLAPIVPRPADAALLPAARPALEELARREDTHIALVSGRSLRDLRARVALDRVYYAGNHGLEIEGPGVHRMHEGAGEARGTLSYLARVLHRELAGIDGVIVEDKGLTLSVHFRMVASETQEARVRDAVHAQAAGIDGVRLTDGKKVVEIRPDVDWHKGRAFRFIRDTLEERFGPGPAIFIGDDRTDEDAFGELGETDCAIVVGDPPQHATAAQTGLRTPEEVADFLHRLARDADA